MAKYKIAPGVPADDHVYVMNCETKATHYLVHPSRTMIPERYIKKWSENTEEPWIFDQASVKYEQAMCWGKIAKYLAANGYKITTKPGEQT